MVTVTREREELIARLMALSGRYDMTATERYEADAEAFYRETGYLSPGKDVPMAMGGQDETERRAAHESWIAGRNRSQQQAIQEAADALAALPPPADMNTAAEHYRQGWQAGHAAADPLPPRPTGSEPINRVDLVRYGVATPGSPTLLTPMADGYWTPWHLAAALVERTCGTCRHANFYTGSEYGMCRGDSIAIGRDITESDGCLLGWSPREDAPEDADGDD